jgi:putative methionine-R-sulfoxide reductase with GAF domain
VPLIVGGECLGVFDLDSPTPNRFGEQEENLVFGWIQELLGRTNFDSRLWS